MKDNKNNQSRRGRKRPQNESRRPIRIQPSRGQNGGMDWSLTGPTRFDPLEALGLTVPMSRRFPSKENEYEYEKLKEIVAGICREDMTFQPIGKVGLRLQKLSRLAGGENNLECDTVNPEGRRVTADGIVQYLCNWFPQNPELCELKNEIEDSIDIEGMEKYFTKPLSPISPNSSNTLTIDDDDLVDVTKNNTENKVSKKYIPLVDLTKPIVVKEIVYID